MNRTKVLVLALFAGYWVVVVVLLVVARGFYDSQLPQAMRLPGNNQRPGEIGTLLLVTALFAVLSTGVIRGWRWTFWLIVIVFLVDIVRVPAAALQLAGIVPRQDPAWSTVLQAVFGLMQFVIALAMLAGYRKSGIWAAT
jgi:nitrate reductase NapE component